jgi:uncharacterized RmlC-like cupin family protein
MSDAYKVHVVRPGQTYEGAQGFTYGAGCSAGTVGAGQICMNVLPMPAGGRAKVHHHENIETIAYLLEGNCSVFYGDRVEQVAELTKGDQIFIPGSVAHAPVNRSGAPCTWIVVHGSGDDQDGIVMLPELDAVLDAL